MGVRVELAGYSYEVEDYTVSEDATPLSAGDSSGSVGSIDLTLILPDPNIERDDPLWLYGPEWMMGESVYLSDSYKGFTLGTVYGCEVNQGTYRATLRCVSRLGDLNVFNINAQPFVGTLAGAFEYYLSLAGVDTDLFVDDSIASRPVTFPGFTGELWFHLKQMASAQDCDIALVSGIILLRPVRTRVAEQGRDIERSTSAGSGAKAQTVEVYWYDSREITDELVYPPGGWNPDVEVLNVNAGETSTYQLELSASVSSIQSPTMQTFVAEDEDSASVYTIVADDGLPVDPAQWTDHGGSLTVEINPDTTTLTVTLVGATGIPVVTGGTSKSFSVALASDTSGSRYSTLRLVGTGVAYTRTLRTFRTGVPASQTATLVGETIDNPFLTDRDAAIRAGSRAAKRWTGLVPTLTGSVVSVNRRGDSGIATYPTNAEVQAALEAELGTPTYADVQTYYTSTLALNTYGDVRSYWFSTVANDYENQVFGNVAGARVWDNRTHRWYRVRSGTLTPDRITFGQADDDLTNADVQAVFDGLTYEDVQTARAGFTYQQHTMMGAYLGA